jgi:hypothetical protein
MMFGYRETAAPGSTEKVMYQAWIPGIVHEVSVRLHGSLGASRKAAMQNPLECIALFANHRFANYKFARRKRTSTHL